MDDIDYEGDDYDDEYYYNSDDSLFDFDEIYDRYNGDDYELDGDVYFGNKYADQFVDNMHSDVISDVIDHLESAFQKLFGIKADNEEDQY